MEKGDRLGPRHAPPQGILLAEADLLRLVEIDPLDNGRGGGLDGSIGLPRQFPGALTQGIKCEGVRGTETQSRLFFGRAEAGQGRQKTGGGEAREQETSVGGDHGMLRMEAT